MSEQTWVINDRRLPDPNDTGWHRVPTCGIWEDAFQLASHDLRVVKKHHNDGCRILYNGVELPGYKVAREYFKAIESAIADRERERGRKMQNDALDEVQKIAFARGGMPK